MYQTEIQKSDALRFGGIKLEMGSSLSALVNLGMIRKPDLQLDKKEVEIKFNNGPKIQKFKEGDYVIFSCELVETDLSYWQYTDAGLVVYTPIAGTIVNNHPETITTGGWNFDKFIPLEHQNGDGTILTVDSVTGSVDGLLVVEDDYRIVENSDGIFGIVVFDSSTVTTESQALTVVYDYTPNVAKEITLNTTGSKTYKYAKISNVNVGGKEWYVTMQEVTNTSPLKLAFPDDDGDDALTIPITLKGRLVKMRDEQSV